MKGINSGTMLLIRKPSSEQAIIAIIKTKVWPKNKTSRIGDQNYFEALLENRTGAVRRVAPPLVRLSITSSIAAGFPL